jgi:hypothetical protein
VRKRRAEKREDREEKRRAEKRRGGRKAGKLGLEFLVPFCSNSIVFLAQSRIGK